MFLSTLVAAAALAATPAPASSTDDEVIIPDTEINVCVVATVEDLVDIRADAQVLLEDAGTTFVDLKALCDDAPETATATPPVPAPPVTAPPVRVVTPKLPAGGGSSAQVDVIPSGAPETGDGSTEVPLTWVLGGLGALVTAGITAMALGARRTLPTR